MAGAYVPVGAAPVLAATGILVGLVSTLAILVPPVRARLRRLVNVLFGRRPFDGQAVLAIASAALGAAQSLDEIARLTVTLPASVLGLDDVALFLRRGDVFEEASEAAADRPRRLAGDRPLARLLAALPGPLMRASLGADCVACLEDLDALMAELVVPLGCKGLLTGFLVCGRRRNGVDFSASDVFFLRTFANQAALSLQTAQAVSDLELRNADLERRAEDRTQELGRSTARLSASLAELDAAYQTLQASQEQLVVAREMAVSGRIAAGIAHEMNKPLGAALNGLMIARELVSECERMADATETDPADRRSAFGDLAAMIESIAEWTNKAAAGIRSVEAHGQKAGGAERGLRHAADLPEVFGEAASLG